ncbi:hypothetical protein J7T55_000955 [Diaporthe amygdali]|uniref:uncharacterized protein n=1 Tax=Phomopsis amygdali TaxID=1214568 RepID=UPI0022FDF8D0|nr:uncharacterized protein J7T55_000955 [Diaporthe amygdali]KAJ0120102.1 hypothetical protein J7T55_000955 [Diaporthe amygdali]
MLLHANAQILLARPICWTWHEEQQKQEEEEEEKEEKEDSSPPMRGTTASSPRPAPEVLVLGRCVHA